MIEVRREVTPRWVFRLPQRGSADGTLRCRNGVLMRLLHHDGEPVLVRVAQTAPDRVLFGAQSASPAACEHGIARMRFALGVDEDLSEFHARFKDDPFIGSSVRARPWLRIRRRPEPFEALAWAICEQLIQYRAAVEIERRILRLLGPRCATTGLRDVPDAAAVGATSPARFQSFELAECRAIALVKAARGVARGWIDLHDHEDSRRRLQAIPSIGTWTCDVLATLGQGRYDRIAAGDLGYLKLVGSLRSGGDPHARASEDEVRELYAPYEEWAALAGAHSFGVPGRPRFAAVA